MHLTRLPSGHWRASVKHGGQRMSLTRSTQNEALEAGTEIEAQVRSMPTRREAERQRRQTERELQAASTLERSARRGPAPLPRFPVEPPCELVRPASYTQLAEWIGISRDAVYAAAGRGLSVWQADRWAVACGLHPATVWPEYIESGQ